MPRNPSSPSFATTASGIQPSSSHWPAWGESSARANSRAGARIIRCSSVRKSVFARVSMVLFGVFFDLADRFLRLAVDVGLDALGGFERLHLVAEGAFLRALGGRLPFRGLVHLGLLRVPARDGERHRGGEGHGERDAPHGPRSPQARTAFTRWRRSARTFGGR